MVLDPNSPLWPVYHEFDPAKHCVELRPDALPPQLWSALQGILYSQDEDKGGPAGSLPK